MSEYSSSSVSHSSKPLKQCHITLIPINDLHLHEEVVDSHIKEIKESLIRLNYFFRPILVSKESRVILDGHHRVAALRDLGAKKVPCIEVNYIDNDEIKLGTWHPVYFGNIDEESLTKQLTDLQLTFEETVNFDDKRLLEKGVAFYLVSKSRTLLLKGTQKVIFKSLLKFFQPDKFKYVPSIQDALQLVENSDASFALLRSRVTKQDVINHALGNDLFAPKTTRHILNFRYQDTRVPLDALF